METGTARGKIPIFCINLARRTDRWRDFQTQKGIQGLQIQRWDAIDGETLSIKDDARISMRVKRNISKQMRRSWQDIYTNGAVGCYLTHYQIWKWLSSSSEEICIILEDDCVVPDDFNIKIRHLWEESEIIRMNRFDICILHKGCGEIHKNNEVNMLPSDDKVEPLKWFFNTTGYIITRSCAKRLLEYALPIQIHVDKYIGLYAEIYNLKIYRIRDSWMSIVSSLSKSDIDDKNCDFCKIPSDFNKTHRAIGLYDFYIGRMCQVFLMGWLGWNLFQLNNKN